jgi:drug/metabolite transporter (DMT)-like permease
LSSFQEPTKKRSFATAGGFVAILLWSMTVALVRSLTEQLGAITAATSAFSVSGVLALASLACRPEKRQLIGRLPRTYLVGCGTLFISYIFLLFFAIDWAENRQQVIEVGLLNYLWPALTVVLSLVLLGKKASWVLLPGTLLAITGVFLVVTHGSSVSWQSFSQNLTSNPAAFSLALAAALFWALYSNLTHKWAGGRKEGGVTLFLPVTAVVLLLFSCSIDEPRIWDRRAVVEAFALGTATYSAYLLWDTAMRRGNVVIVVAASYLTPLFSTIVSCLYLAVVPQPRLWAGCGVLALGSLLSWKSVSNASSKGSAEAATDGGL